MIVLGKTTEKISKNCIDLFHECGFFPPQSEFFAVNVWIDQLHELISPFFWRNGLNRSGLVQGGKGIAWHLHNVGLQFACQCATFFDIAQAFDGICGDVIPADDDGLLGVFNHAELPRQGFHGQVVEAAFRNFEQ